MLRATNQPGVSITETPLQLDPTLPGNVGLRYNLMSRLLAFGGGTPETLFAAICIRHAVTVKHVMCQDYLTRVKSTVFSFPSRVMLIGRYL